MYGNAKNHVHTYMHTYGAHKTINKNKGLEQTSSFLGRFAEIDTYCTAVGCCSKVYNLSMYLQVYLSVGHPDNENVVERVDAVDLGEQLVHHRVGHAGAVPHAASCLADSVDFVEDDDVEHAPLALIGLDGERAHEQRCFIFVCVCMYIKIYKYAYRARASIFTEKNKTETK